MATKKKTTAKPKSVRQGDKSRFIRAQSRSLSAGELQELAAAQGLIISVPFIHNIRSKAGIDSRALLKKGKKLVKGGKKAQEKAFREIVIALGPARAKALLEQVETALIVEAGA